MSTLDNSSTPASVTLIDNELTMLNNRVSGRLYLDKSTLVSYLQKIKAAVLKDLQSNLDVHQVKKLLTIIENQKAEIEKLDASNRAIEHYVEKELSDLKIRLTKLEQKRVNRITGYIKSLLGYTNKE